MADEIRRPAPRAVEVREVDARTLLTKQGPRSYTLNPYRGCPVSCAYCYVPRLSFMRYEERPWGSYVDVKRDAAAKLDAELARLKDPSSVMMSTATDPYVPQEAELGVTRSLLEVFARHPRHKLSVLTKSTLYLRDLDLLARLERLSLGCSVSTFRDSLAAKIEPWGALPSERVAALAQAAAAGIHTVVLWAPMLVPSGATESDFEALLAPIRDRGITAVKTDTANYRGTFSPAVLKTIALEGERFADPRDERLVGEVRRRLDLDHRSPALAAGEQPSLFDDV